MSISNISTLTQGTINGLNSLYLDELTTNTFTSETMNGDLFYIDKVEAKEVIVDTKLSLTNTGVISVGTKTITDIELTYLDGVRDFIQKQIDNREGQELQLQAQINHHTNQIEDLQAKDVVHDDTLITHTDQIDQLFEITDDIYNSLDLDSNAINELQWKTIFQSYSSTATNFSKQINVPNGNIGYVNSLLPNNFYVQSNLASGNNVVINSGLANIFLQSQNVYLGRTDSTGRKSNLYMISDDDSTYECQSSAFTETLKQLIISNGVDILDLQHEDTLHNTSIQTLNTKTQKISNGSADELILTTNSLKVGNPTTVNSESGRKSNILFYDSTNSIWETQSSAFTENLKSVVIDTASSNAIQQTSIDSLISKTQNISSANSSATNMSRPLYITDRCIKIVWKSQLYFKVVKCKQYKRLGSRNA